MTLALGFFKIQQIINSFIIDSMSYEKRKYRFNILVVLKYLWRILIVVGFIIVIQLTHNWYCFGKMISPNCVAIIVYCISYKFSITKKAS